MPHVKEEFEHGPGGGGPFDGLAFLLSQLGFVASRGFHQALAPLGIEPRHFLLMRHVMRAEGQTQQALGEMLGIPPSRMVAVVDQLEALGLVERRAHPGDRRARALHVTPAGRRLMGKAFEVAVEHSSSFGTTLSPDERGQLISLLQKLSAEKQLVMGVHPGLTVDHPKA